MSIEEMQIQRNIFAKNLNHYMKTMGVTQNDIVVRFNLTASTVSDWCNAKKYPRADKIQMLADYLGILKSDLTDEKISENNQSNLIISGAAGIGKSKLLQETFLNALGETEENMVIYHRNGETHYKKLSKEKMDMFAKMMEAFDEYDDNL